MRPRKPWCSVREVWLLALAYPLALAGIAGCGRATDASAQAGSPVQVPFNASLARVRRACQRAADFVTDSQQVALPREIQPGVTVTIYPRRRSHRNPIAVLASGNIVAKFTNTGDQPFPAWGLDAHGTSCWQIGTRKGALVSRFVSTNPNVPPKELPVSILFANDHPAEKAEWRPRQKQDEGSQSVFRRVGFASGSRFGGVPLPQIEDDAWVTCVTNGCCMSGFH